jgi:DNA polymerase-3 subunit gamma/tau
MYQVIARKYRPQAFDELISQEHVKTTLENAITQGRIAHGYIFSGQRGTGKTTVARIFARCLNCEQGPTPTPCGKCASCLEIAGGSSMDVIEIDAASNRGINEMRELRESVRFRPARDRYKVFIIDEAHQITSEAFNALLKTLEEPPEWVVFMLCTTESHKIPSTIVSRCQQFSFRSVDFAELVARMEWIMQQEGITADADAVAVLARAGEGSVRDSLSALDQAIACCGNKLDAAEVRALLGLFSLESLGRVTTALAEGDSQKMFAVVAELEANGRSLQHFARELARHFRNLVVVKITGGETRLVAASQAEQQKLAEAAAPFSEEDLTRYLQLSLDLFRDLQSSLQPRLHLEMGLLRMVQAGRLQPIEEALAGLSGGTAPSKPAPAATPALPAAGDLRSRLHAALLEAKLTHVADALEHSELTESPAELVFTAPKMYQLYLKQPDFEAAAKRIAGRPVRVTIKIGDAAPSAPAPVPKREDEATARALSHAEVKRFQEIFPDAQVRTVRNLKDT